ncbi:hypothetical protein CPC08DRAFT_713433 [Agrocybe pediades]|nr:hypothetical protein CPC08DRAFT_713433 [Agrocybe pediades]
MNFLEADVPDITDFPPQEQAPGLRTLDGSFRCDICGELYDAPVTIICGHCFCSACIRTALQTKQECPRCRKRTDEAHIRPNPALENVITSWKAARPYVLQLIKSEEEVRASRSRRQVEETDTPMPKKRKRTTDRASSPEITDMGSSFAGPSRKPVSTKSIVPKSPTKQKKAKANEVIDMTSPDSDADDVAELPTPRAPKGLAPKDDELVQCPLCQKKVKYGVLNSHMDNGCKDPNSVDNAVKSWSKMFDGAGGKKKKGKQRKKDSDSDDEYPLPISNYTTLKDKQLKEMLIEQEIPVTGDRALWELRHQRWVTIFNANLDRSGPNRKTKGELRKELKKWEEDMTKKKKPPIQDLKEYQRKHKGEFAKLVEAARPKKVTKSSSPDDSQSETISAPPQSSSQSPNASDGKVVDSEEEPR